jgi:hypothetical protein
MASSATGAAPGRAACPHRFAGAVNRSRPGSRGRCSTPRHPFAMLARPASARRAAMSDRPARLDIESLASKAPDMDSSPLFRTVSGGAQTPVAHVLHVERRGQINLSDTDRLFHLQENGGNDEGGLAHRLLPSCLAGAGRGDRRGRYDLAPPPRTRPIDRQDRPQLTVAERQAKAMAASGIMDHSVAGRSPTGFPMRIWAWRPKM